jgi:hypothetical protein
MKNTRENLENLFIDYWSNFLTVDRFAEHYQLTIDQARSIISRGRVIFYSNNDQYRDHFTDNFYSKSKNLQQRSHNLIVDGLL